MTTIEAKEIISIMKTRAKGVNLCTKIISPMIKESAPDTNTVITSRETLISELEKYAQELTEDWGMYVEAIKVILNAAKEKNSKAYTSIEHTINI